MSKAARRARQAHARHAATHSVALGDAAQARDSFDLLWSSTEEHLSGVLHAVRPNAPVNERIRVPIDQVHQLVDEFKTTGRTWPAATYVPGAMIGGVLLRQFLEDLGVDPTTAPPDVQLMGTHLGVRTSALAGWHRAPLIAVFDDALADALVRTPMSGEIPRELLQRLPAWTVYVATPWLRAGSGVFVNFDTGAAFDHGRPLSDEMVDDFVLLFAVAEPPTSFLAYFRCSEPTIKASIDAQRADAKLNQATPDDDVYGYDAAQAASQDLFGRPYRDVLEQVMALVLYLCSEEPDIRDIEAPGGTRSARAGGQPRIVEVGYRVGAALRTAATRGTAEATEGHDHARPTPHIRTAHWHTYWYGARHDPAARTARLRWIPPLLVNAHVYSPVPTARPVYLRPAADPPTSH